MDRSAFALVCLVLFVSERNKCACHMLSCILRHVVGHNQLLKPLSVPSYLALYHFFVFIQARVLTDPGRCTRPVSPRELGAAQIFPPSSNPTG
jgi:hypothetical protein